MIKHEYISNVTINIIKLLSKKVISIQGVTNIKLEKMVATLILYLFNNK